MTDQMRIENGRAVYIDFTLTNGAGKQLDQSPAEEPLGYLHGSEGILPALANGLEGKVEGDAFDIVIEPMDGYGEHQASEVRALPRSQFPADMDITLGMQFDDPSGRSLIPGTITGVTSDLVTLDMNHPLAGVTLRFVGEVVEVCEGSDEPINSG